MNRDANTPRSRCSGLVLKNQNFIEAEEFHLRSQTRENKDLAKGAGSLQAGKVGRRPRN